jgi:gamma-glutamyltranspeptidase / glutathione hydrolase
MTPKKLFLFMLLLGACSSDSPTSAPEIPSSANNSDLVATSEIIPEERVSPDIRPEVGGLNGALVSGHPLASQVGFEVLRNGGNAIDAAVSMAAVLAVVRPHMNSIGGDTFALFYDGDSKEVMALNASGRAGALGTSEFVRSAGHEQMPFTGAKSITVPGALSAWVAALERYGTISLADALQPAVDIAENGFMVSKTLAEDLYSAAERLNDAGQQIYRPGGQPLQAGDLLKSPTLAATLRQIQQNGPEVFYGGEIAETLASFILENGGHLTAEDFRNHTAEWTPTVTGSFQQYTVHTVPPNSQGMVLLQMLGMADNIDFASHTANSAPLLHQLVEISKIAFSDRDKWISDPAFNNVPVDAMLNRDYLTDRFQLVSDTAQSAYTPGFGEEIFDAGHAQVRGSGDTIYLMVVDSDNNAVSWVQSLFGTFGSNLVEPTTGIVLQNRGAGFSIEPGNPNEIMPGKRPFHTLMSTLVTDTDDDLVMTIGTPGGGGQPQFISQAMINTLIYGLSPQQSVEAPRFRIGSGTSVALESRIGDTVTQAMQSLGHNVQPAEGWTANFGNVQMIYRLPNGILRTGADMRREAAAQAF